MITGTRFAAPAPVALKPATCCRNRTRKKPWSAIPPYMSSVSRFATLKLRWRNSASGSIGAGARRSHAMKAANSRVPPTSGSATPGSPQPRSGCSISPNEIPASAAAHSSAPSDVEPRAGSAEVARLRHVRARQPQRHQHDREVEEEHPAPRGAVHQLAADQRAEHVADPAPRRPRADRRAALGLREDGHDDGERGGREQRAEHALQRAGEDEQLDRRRDRAQQRGDAEPGDARREHAPLAVQIGERAGDEDQRREA